MAEAGYLDSGEAARRLGIKPSSLYVYVSRGLLQSHRAAKGRGSLFDPQEIEAFRRGTRRRDESDPIAPIRTRVAETRSDGPHYRGRSAVELVGSSTFEKVAEHLWGVGEDGWTPAPIDSPRGLSHRDLLRVAVALVSSKDEWRSDLRSESVVRSARLLIATASSSLPESVPGHGRAPGSIASMLASRLSARSSSGEIVEAIDAALILFAAEEVTGATLAVRLAASSRAELYDAVLAGLGVFGGSSVALDAVSAYDALRRAEAESVDEAVLEHLRRAGARVRSDGPSGRSDPRGAVLEELVPTVATPRKARLFERFRTVLSDRDAPSGSAGFALGAVTWAIEAPRDASAIILSIAAMAGWTAHYLEELEERAFRLHRR